MQLNGYAFNYAALLKEITGTVSYKALKKNVTEFGAMATATKEEINGALFWASNHFNCSQ